MDDTALPRVIQGGMGVAISDWRLARAVAQAGQLGVVSGTALDVVCARRLQLGDPGGHVRWALANFPVPRVAEHILRTYYVAGGKPPGAPFRPVMRFTAEPARGLQELTIAANFVEVFLARHGHGGRVGINYLRKIELPLPFACYGALLGGVDHVVVGAGNPADLPLLVDRLVKHDPVELPIRVQGATSADGDVAVRFAPRELFGADLPEPPILRRPRVEAIVASVDLAGALAADPVTRPDGFVVEGYVAGGHNAPPRGPRRLDERGQPVYGERDIVEPGELAELGLPYWMAGGYGSPEGLDRAISAGARGIQVGTAFALCRESGMAPELKRRLLAEAYSEVRVRTDSRASPTGFPFKVVELPGTLSEEDIYAGRPRLCDMGVLRSAYRRPDGTVGYRCPAEPVDIFEERRGGRASNTIGRRCLCNGLMATAGFAQIRPGGLVEPPVITAGDNFAAVRQLLLRSDGTGYSATDVLAYLLAGPSPPG